MEKKNFYRQLRLSCVVLMAAFALNVSAQSSRQVRPYSFNKKGVVVTSNAVLYNGRKISDRASSFKDLGWGYGKDTFEVYYMGRKINDARSSSFKVLKDGYAEDAFDTYYRGKVVK